MNNDSIKILQENGIQVVNGAVSRHDLPRAVNILHTHKVKGESVVVSNTVNETLHEMFEKDAKLSLKALSFIKKTSGVEASYDYETKQLNFYDPSFSVKVDEMVELVEGAFLTCGNSFTKETVEKIKKDKELESLIKELPKLQKEGKKLKTLTDKVYNGVIEDMAKEGKVFYDSTGEQIKDHNKLYRSDDDKLLKEYYQVSNDAICKEVPGTKKEYCPYLVNQDKIIKLKHKIMDKIIEYHPEFKDKYISIENQDELIDINRKLFGVAAAGHDDFDAPTDYQVTITCSNEVEEFSSEEDELCVKYQDAIDEIIGSNAEDIYSTTESIKGSKFIFGIKSTMPKAELIKKLEALFGDGATVAAPEQEEPYGKSEMMELKKLLINVQNLMKEGMHNLNLAMEGKSYEGKKVSQLVEACNHVSTCSAAQDIFDF